MMFSVEVKYAINSAKALGDGNTSDVEEEEGFRALLLADWDGWLLVSMTFERPTALRAAVAAGKFAHDLLKDKLGEEPGEPIEVRLISIDGLIATAHQAAPPSPPEPVGMR